jgi:glycerol-3-phosphate dehydrogenase (NAD(P)+)
MSADGWLVVGVTAWGLALTQHLAHAGHRVQLLARSPDEADRVRLRRTDPARISAVRLPPEVDITCDATAAGESAIVLLAVPSQTMRENATRIAGTLRPGTIVVSAAKGIEIESGMLMSGVIEAACGDQADVSVLSGPNLAEEVARGLPSTTVVASTSEHAARAVQDALTTPEFRVYTQDDVVGVELGGALKNIIALGAGINDGLGYGDNAKAAFMTRGLAEITRLGVAMGANPLTFAGLSGLGDLIATCASPLSRNRRVGEELGRGRPLDDILARLGHVAEGVSTTAAARALAARFGVTMPIVEQMHRVLFEGYSAADAARTLMAREPRAESPL